MAHSVFSDDDSKKLIRVWPKCLNAPERCHWVLSENGMVNRIWSYHSWDFEGRNIKKTTDSAKKYWNSVSSGVGILLMEAQNPIVLSIF